MNTKAADGPSESRGSSQLYTGIVYLLFWTEIRSRQLLFSAMTLELTTEIHLL